MTVKNLQTIFKDEGCKPNDDVKIKISVELGEDEWLTKTIPIESYSILKDGTILLGYCLWKEN